MLARAGVRLEAKPFAMGVRIEHPQPLIDRIQYGRARRATRSCRRPRTGSRSRRDDGRGAFSFCMCPGGWIVPAATEPDGVVVNGMSLSRRDSPYANSRARRRGRARRPRAARPRSRSRRRRAPAPPRARGRGGRRRRAARAGDARDRLRARPRVVDACRRRATSPASPRRRRRACSTRPACRSPRACATRSSRSIARCAATSPTKRCSSASSRARRRRCASPRDPRRSSRRDLAGPLSVRRGRRLRGRHRVGRARRHARRARYCVHALDALAHADARAASRAASRRDRSRSAGARAPTCRRYTRDRALAGRARRAGSSLSLPSANTTGRGTRTTGRAPPASSSTSSCVRCSGSMIWMTSPCDELLVDRAS